jgi:hypothetical protein
MMSASRSARGLTLAMLSLAIAFSALQAAETPSEDPAAQAAAYSAKAADLRADAAVVRAGWLVMESRVFAASNPAHR